VIDPRSSVIARRLSGVRRIVGFCSAKGGVGKTTCTALSGLLMVNAGRRVGLLDLDLQGASAHILLGVRPRLPDEGHGIRPLPVRTGLFLMGAAAFAGDRGLALRGSEVSDAILEILAVTLWGELDALLIDMPPGIGEEVLDLARLVPRLEVLVVSTPSPLSVAVVERLMGVLGEMRVTMSGVLANAVRGPTAPVESLAARAGVPYLGAVPWDDTLEAACGDTDRLSRSKAARALSRCLADLRLT